MKHFWVKAGVAVVVLGILGGVGSILFMDFYPQDVPVEIDRLGGEAIEEVRTLNAPKGTLTTTTNDAYEVTSDAATTPADPALTDWPLYNRTLEGDRYSPLSEITTKNVGNLKVLCTYDTDVLTSFESGLVVVNGALIGTTEHDTFSLDPSTCAENWRVHEEFPPSILGVNRGVAFLDGTLFVGCRTEGWWPMTSRPARSSGRPRSPIPRSVNRFLQRRSPGTEWSGSAKPAATTRV